MAFGGLGKIVGGIVGGPVGSVLGGSIGGAMGGVQNVGWMDYVPIIPFLKRTGVFVLAMILIALGIWMMAKE